MKKKIYYFNANVFILLLIFLTMSASAFAQNEVDANAKKPLKDSAYNDLKLTYKIIDTDSSTFGYDIYADDKLLIRQKSIPAIPGNKGFKTKAQAEKVAKLVISKIKAGEMPPSVKIEELKKLKAI